jgi:hypothetical protein
MNKAARTLAAGVAVAALTLTGCAGAPSDAATVNGVRIADSTVREVAQTLTAASGTESSVALRQATYDLLLGEASRQIAASTGTVVPEADKKAIVAQNQLASAVAATPQGAPWADAVGTTYVLLEELGEDSYLTELNKLDVTVNPRYGQWDASRVTFTDASLARDASAASLRR